MFTVLDEESFFPKATDMTFTTKLHKTLKKARMYTAPKAVNDLEFTVTHFAGQVSYKTDSFLEKNRDTLSLGIMELFTKSTHAIVQELFSPDFNEYGNTHTMKTARKGVGKGRNGERDVGGGNGNGQTHGTKRKKQTVATHFRDSLDHLMKRLETTTPHFVRCIKTNLVKEASNWQEEVVLKQLKYSGVTDTVRIRRDGFPVRLTFVEAPSLCPPTPPSLCPPIRPRL